MATRRLGIDAALYLNNYPTIPYNAPSWVRNDRVADLTETSGWNTAPAGDRGTGIDTMAKTTATLEISGRIRVSDSDAGYLAFLAAYLARDTPLDVMVLNGKLDSDGARGFRGLYHLSNFVEAQGMQDVLYRDFTLVPAAVDSTTPHQSVVVTAGAPVYTTFAAPP